MFASTLTPWDSHDFREEESLCLVLLVRFQFLIYFLVRYISLSLLLVIAIYGIVEMYAYDLYSFFFFSLSYF